MIKDHHIKIKQYYRRKSSFIQILYFLLIGRNIALTIVFGFANSLQKEQTVGHPIWGLTVLVFFNLLSEEPTIELLQEEFESNYTIKAQNK
jgi:hypothetical protein